MTYLLDSNVFIEAQSRYYSQSLCPGFWDWLLQANQKGTVFSIDKVRDELQGRNDDLSSWSNRCASRLFLPAVPSITDSLAAVSIWVQQQRYDHQAVAEFLSVADYWLIAHALTGEWTVVTHEVSSPNSKKRVKIPDACLGVGVTCINPFQMLRDEGARFVLDKE